MSSTHTISTTTVDVLVLGAGLSGMRAAWGALEANPKARVMVATLRNGPAGSSFANKNNALGMQALFTDEERLDFFQAALELARPGFVDPGLIRILASESAARLKDMEGLGIKFQKGAHGKYLRGPGCFTPNFRHAVVFSDLGHAFAQFKKHLPALGAEFLPEFQVAALLQEKTGSLGRVCGALFQAVNNHDLLAVRAKSVVMALGGPACLYAWNMACPGNTGSSYALLERAGAKLVNTGFIQFLWAKVPKKSFWNIRHLAQPGMRLKTPKGRLLRLPRPLRDLAHERGTHCPFAYGRDDAKMDLFVAKHAGEDGTTWIVPPLDEPYRVAPLAHAGNGGAGIDEHGRTSVAGLFAVGECASGMHGANRIGGAMVAATQVFGARAGRAAGLDAANQAHTPKKVFKELTLDPNVLPQKTLRIPQKNGVPQNNNGVPLTKAMHGHVALTGSRRLGSVIQGLEKRLKSEKKWDRGLAVESALIVTRFLRKMKTNANGTQSNPRSQ